MSENTNIWHEVNESTKVLYILNRQDIKSIIRDISHQYKKGIIVNLFDFPTIDFFKFKDMPQNLPNLEVLFVHNLNFESLEGFPKNLPKLKKIFIFNSSLKSLKGLPSKLTSLKNININNVPLESLRYLPKSLPNLENFKIIQTNIQTLEYFPTNIPVLKEITLLRNKLISLKGFPHEIPMLELLWADHNQITTLEHLPYRFPKRKPDYRDKTHLKPVGLKVKNNPIRTLAGIKFPNFFKIMVYHIANWNAYIYPCHPDNKPLGSHICPTGLKLIRNYYKKKIEVETLELNMNTGEKITSKMVKDPARYDAIVEFYRKTPMELAQQYIENPKSLTEGELERLGWEGGYQERQLLESNIPSDSHLLKEISQRFTHKLPSGLSILK